MLEKKKVLHFILVSELQLKCWKKKGVLQCWGCELEISGIPLTRDLRVMDMSEFDVILVMD